MNRSWMRTAVTSCAIACAAMAAGPGAVSITVASADLIDIDILDIFDDKKKEESDHPARYGGNRQPGSGRPGSGRAGTVPEPGSAGAGGGNVGSGGPSSGINDNAPKIEPHIGNGRVGGTDERESGDVTNRQGRDATDRQGGAGTNGPGSPGAAERSPRRVAGVTQRGGSTSGSGGSQPEAGVSGSTGQSMRGGVAESTAESGGAAESGGGAGIISIPGENASSIHRAPNLPPVPTGPQSRTIVIRDEDPPASGPSAPAAPPPVLAPPAPVVVPPPPAAPVAPAPPPALPPAPPPQLPVPSPQPPPGESTGPGAVPDGFRTGYSDYLKLADTSDLLAAALPGVLGMMALTAAGGVTGYRQARAAQTLPPAGIARFLE